MNFFKKRLLVLVVAGSLLVLIAVFYIQFVLSRPIGSGPAGPQLDREPFSKQWADRPVRVVGIGDSITAGLGARSKDHTFFNRLILNPGDEYPDMQGKCLKSVIPNLEHENLAISGSTKTSRIPMIEAMMRYDACFSKRLLSTPLFAASEPLTNDK